MYAVDKKSKSTKYIHNKAYILLLSVSGSYLVPFFRENNLATLIQTPPYI